MGSGVNEEAKEGRKNCVMEGRMEGSKEKLRGEMKGKRNEVQREGRREGSKEIKGMRQKESI